MIQEYLPRPRATSTTLAMAVGILVASGLTHARPEAPAPVSAPAPRHVPNQQPVRHHHRPTPAQEMAKFEASAKATADNMLADMANPASLDRSLGRLTFGNAHALRPQQWQDYPLPHFRASYDPTHNLIDLSSSSFGFTPERPFSPAGVTSLSMRFNVGLKPNVIDYELAHHQKLDAVDFADVVEADTSRLTRLRIQHAGGQLVAIALSPSHDMMVQHSHHGHANAPENLLKPGTVERLVNNMELTEYAQRADMEWY